MQQVPELPPLPNIEVNPLRDFNFFNNQCAFPVSPDSIHIKAEFEPPIDSTLTEMLPVFSAFFGQNFSESLASEEDLASTSSKSDKSFVNVDEDSTSYTICNTPRHPEGMTSSTTAPVWIPPPSEVPVTPEEESRKRMRSVSPVRSLSPPATPPFSPSSLNSSVSFPSSFRPVRIRPTWDSRRLSANLRERRRTRTLIDAFSTLRKTIPLPNEEKATKIQTLQAAANYIEFLHEVYEASAYEIVHGQVPKDAKVGVIYALSVVRRKKSSKIFHDNWKSLSFAFNLYFKERKLERDETTVKRSFDDDKPSSFTSTDDSAKRRRISYCDVSNSSHQTSPPPCTSSSPTVSSTLSSSSKCDVSNKKRTWTWDY